MTTLQLEAPTWTAPARSGRLALLAAIFLAFVDNFAMLPLVGPRAVELGADALGVGVAVAAYSAANLAFNLVGGALADRFGRRAVLVISLLVSPIPIALYAVASSLLAFVALRIVHGAVGGLIASAVFAALADVAPAGSRGRSLGRAGALIGATAVLAPAIAGVIRQRAGTEVVLIALALLMAAGALLIVRFLPETLAGAGSTDGDGGRPPGEGRRTWTRLLRDPRLRVSFLGIGILMAAVGTVTAFVPVQLEMRGEPASFGGALFSAFGLVAVAVMLSRASGMVDRYGPVLPSVGGLVALAGALVLLVGTGGVPGVAAAMIMLGLGYGLLFPGTAGAIALAAVPAERGRAYGVFNVAFDLGVTAGPLLGGLLAAGAATGTSGAAFVPALVLVLLGIPALIALGRRAHGGLPGVQDA